MTERIASLNFSEDTPKTRSVEAEHERAVAMTDLLHNNSFSLVGAPCGPYAVVLKSEENRLMFDLTDSAGASHKIALPVAPLKRIIRDYFMICESYYAALKEAKSHKLETIDMARRGMHNEGAEAVQLLLASRITTDFQTARRLFTLICVMHMK